MAPTVRRLVGLALPVAVFSQLDTVATLAGQSAAYWAGDYARVNEASPTFNHLLQLHPAAFVGGGLTWVALVAAILLLLPDTLALVVSIAVTTGHAVGVSTWLVWHFKYGYQAVNGLILVTAVVLAVCQRVGWQARPPAAYTFRRWPGSVRYPLAAALFAVGVYLFLWPRTP